MADASEPDAQKRCLLVLKWFLASLKRQQYAGRDESAGVKKPLNAFLGEIFMGAWGGSNGEGRTCLISEQVSHHPPVTACYLWNDEQGVRAEGYACQNITFSGTVNIKQIGHAIIHLDKWNEDYLIPLPSVKVSGLITGTPYPELVGSYDIVSSSGFVATVDFSGKRFLGLAGKKNGLHAAVYSADDSSRKHPIYTLEGTWNDVFTIRDEKANSVIEEFNTNAHPALPVQVPDETMLDPYESRKAWGPTISALNSGNMQAVVDAKSKVEQGQREMRKQEEREGKTWTPLFFQKVQSEPRLEKLKGMAHGDAEMDGTQGIWRWIGNEKADQIDRPFHGDLLHEKHRSTIKALRIKNCKLTNDWEWKRVLNSIACIPALEYLSFTNPSIKYNWNQVFNFHFGVKKCEKLIYRGDGQQQLVDELVAYEEWDAVRVAVEDQDEEDQDGEERERSEDLESDSEED
ncbi:Oxysterol-binding protein, partial [Aureobasidium melanogenum]